MARFGLADRWAYRFPGGSLPTGEIFPNVGMASRMLDAARPSTRRTC